jgi:carbamoyltransferase
MSLWVGVSGARRNAGTALYERGTVLAICEQERLTRTRREALDPGKLPYEALDAVLQIGARARNDVSGYAVAESAIHLPAGLTIERVDHHQAHAATSFYTSPFDNATVLVCDQHGRPEVSVWRGENGTVRRHPFPWSGPGFASLYSQATEALGFRSDRDEHRVEALAQVAGQSEDAVQLPVSYTDGELTVSPAFRASIANALASNGHGPNVPQAARVAAATQRQLGELLLQLLHDVKACVGGDNLCLGGGLFFNSYFNSVVAQSDVFERTYVPANPGNTGAALGAALLVAGHRCLLGQERPLSAFLGPDYQVDEIKRTLDNCKLSYDYHHNGELIESTAKVLAKGQLVGWFQGRMEWGSRALGNRSILASPVSPYVLENLNLFLKRREHHRPYSVSVCEEDAPRFFRGPATSRFMEYEYEVLERDALGPLLPLDASRLRVHTVPESAGLFHDLLKAAGALTGVPILVNTSFNGFNEPIVCTPRDAVRVFYGTGLDMVALDSFVLRK